MSAMYALVGFTAVLSLAWGAWSSNYFLSATDLSGVARILPSDLAYILFSVALPVILMLLIVLVIMSLASNHMTRSALKGLLVANRGGLEDMQTMSKSLIILQKLGFTSQFYATLPIVVNDICVSIADIITKSGLASDMVVFDSLNKSGDSRLYAICNIILAAKASIPHFDENLRRKVKKDAAVAASIVIFSRKYNKLLKALKAYDASDLVYGVMEGGLLGQVRGIFVSALGGENIHVKSDNSTEQGESAADSAAGAEAFFGESIKLAPSDVGGSDR
jgi:hypothetical protein